MYLLMSTATYRIYLVMQYLETLSGQGRSILVFDLDDLDDLLAIVDLVHIVIVDLLVFCRPCPSPLSNVVMQNSLYNMAVDFII